MIFLSGQKLISIVPILFIAYGAKADYTSLTRGFLGEANFESTQLMCANGSGETLSCQSGFTDGVVTSYSFREVSPALSHFGLGTVKVFGEKSELLCGVLKNETYCIPYGAWIPLANFRKGFGFPHDVIQFYFPKSQGDIVTGTLIGSPRPSDPGDVYDGMELTSQVDLKSAEQPLPYIKFDSPIEKIWDDECYDNHAYSGRLGLLRVKGNSIIEDFFDVDSDPYGRTYYPKHAGETGKYVFRYSATNVRYSGLNSVDEWAFPCYRTGSAVQCFDSNMTPHRLNVHYKIESIKNLDLQWSVANDTFTQFLVKDTEGAMHLVSHEHNRCHDPGDAHPARVIDEPLALSASNFKDVVGVPNTWHAFQDLTPNLAQNQSARLIVCGVESGRADCKAREFDVDANKNLVNLEWVDLPTPVFAEPVLWVERLPSSRATNYYPALCGHTGRNIADQCWTYDRGRDRHHWTIQPLVSILPWVK